LPQQVPVYLLGLQCDRCVLCDGAVIFSGWLNRWAVVLGNIMWVRLAF